MKRLNGVVFALILAVVMTLFPADVFAASGGGDLGLSLPEDYNTPNTVNWSFNTIDGGSINSRTYSGKIQVLVLFRTNGLCYNSNSTIRSIAASSWVSNENVQVIAVGIGESDESESVVKEHVISYKQTYAPDCNDIVFGYVTNSYFWNSLIRPYRALMGLPTSGSMSITFAVNYIIDTDNNFRFTWQGSYLSDYYASTLSLLDDSFSGDSGIYRLNIGGTNDYASAYEVLDILNEYRGQNGLSELVMDEELLDTAMLRAAETAVYYSHTRPDYSECFTAFPSKFRNGINRENIAVGQISARNVMTAWKNSSGHNTNMLADSNSSVGIGCFIDSNGVRYWVQVFSSAAGTAEEVKSSGTKAVIQEISAAAGMIDIDVSPASIQLRTGQTATVTLKNRNAGWSYSSPEIYATYIETADPDIAYAAIGNDGRIIVTPVSEGQTSISIGFVPSISGKPLTVTASVFVMPPYDPGDINGDGEVNVQDGVLMQRILANLESDQDYLSRADLNGDGKVDVQDGVKMQRILANLE